MYAARASAGVANSANANDQAQRHRGQCKRSSKENQPAPGVRCSDWFGFRTYPMAGGSTSPRNNSSNCRMT